MDRVAEAAEGLLIDVTAGDVEDHVNVNGVDGGLPQNGEFREGSRLHYLGDLDLGLSSNAAAQFRDEPVNLGVVFRSLVGREPENVAVVITELRVAQRHDRLLPSA